MHRTTMPRTWTAVLLAAVCSSSALAVTLDSFTASLPPNPCLPNTNAAVVFEGPHCDGVTCPPDPFAPGGCDGTTADQMGAAGVLSGTLRSIDVGRIESSDLKTAFAFVNTASGRLEITESGGGFGHFADAYYGAYEPSASAMNLDMTAPGAGSIEFSLSGDVSASQPLHMYCELNSSLGQASVVLLIEHTGLVTLPLASFDSDPSFDPTSVDLIGLAFSDCPTGGNCGTDILPARSYSIGPISIGASGPTPAVRSTWARVKAHYR